MKLKEVFNSEYGIFEKIFEPDFPVLYQQIFGEVNPLLIDIQVRRKYGDKELTSDITTETAHETVKAVITMKFDEWSKQIQTFNIAYDVLNPTTKTTSIEKTSNVDETGNNTNVDSKTTFNTGEFNNDTKQERNNTGNRQSTETETSSESGVSNKIPVSEIIQKEMSLRKTNFKEIVISDLVNELTLEIYSDDY